MHDFHLADQIYHLIIDYAQKNDLKRVTKVVIELGSMVEHGEEILAENLVFNIKMLAPGGVADGLRVTVNKTKNNGWILKEIEGE